MLCYVFAMLLLCFAVAERHLDEIKLILDREEPDYAT